jgi:LuxR family transcriptional regulator, maltose regulon positive regulatory protein
VGERPRREDGKSARARAGNVTRSGGGFASLTETAAQNVRNAVCRGDPDAEQATLQRDTSSPTESACPLGPTDQRSATMTSADEGSANGVESADGRAVVWTTKLHVPVVRDRRIDRITLIDMLFEGDSRKVTLLSAPAGWGKTTLLAQWVASAGGNAGEGLRFGWLSLDSSDNDPMWFWTYVICALREASPGVGSRALELLDMGANTVQAVLPTLMNELAVVADRIVLIVDDYHLVINPDLHEQMTLFINRMPANLRLVLATRSDPLLPLARLRATGELLELRTDDLRFAAGEAERLFNGALALNLSQKDVELLYQRTEGWAAGLYLAALSLAKRTDSAALIRTFAGDNRHIVDYLMAEVLDRQPPHLRNFMLRTSILRRLSGALCDAVLQDTDSASVLETIERENLFLVPLDLSRGWYRYHHLFAELLLTELRRSEPDLVPSLRQRAAAWFAAQGHTDAAVHHLAAAGDIEGTAQVIAAGWVHEFNAGGLSTVSGWLDQLPRESVMRDPRLSVARAWIALNEGRIDDGAFWIQAIEAHVASDEAAGGTIGAQAVVLRAIHSFKMGDVATTLETAARATTLDLGEAPLARSGVYCIYGNGLYFSGRIDEAQAAYARAAQQAENIGDRRYRIYALGYLALIAAERGQLADAEHQIRRANGGGTDLAAEEHFVGVMLSLAAATVLEMRGDSAAAADAADLAVTSARQGGAIPEIAKALFARAEIATRLGDQQTATASRDEAHMLLRRCADNGIDQTFFAADQGARATVSARLAGCTPHEELTPKELDVLRLLATRLSRREIGERLYVSLNTVKTHQRAVYRKLDVEDRAAAVKRARELGLV